MILDENDSSHCRLRVLTFYLGRPYAMSDVSAGSFFFLLFPNGERARVVPLMSVRPLPSNRPAATGRQEITHTAAKNYRDTVITRIKNRICDGARRTRVPGCLV